MKRFITPSRLNYPGLAKLTAVLAVPVVLSGLTLQAQDAGTAVARLKPPMIAADADASSLPEMVVIAKALDVARDEIVPSLGATKYTISGARLDAQAQGENAPFNQTLLRFPGMAEDSFGQLHLRGEHANLQYRINGVLLPEGISGFGQELSTRFVDQLSLITGALPAQFGDRTAGIVDVQTKNGTSMDGGEMSVYGGSNNTIMPALEYGGLTGRLTYYFTGSYLHNTLGIENPTGSSTAIHDETSQYKGFGYLSYLIDDTSRLSLILSAAHSDFQIPNNPGQSPGFSLDGGSKFDSAKLNENQTEQNNYGIATYQRKLDEFDFQVSAFSRESSVLFRPDDTGDLIFNGVASRVDRAILTDGLQADSSYKLNEQNTLRGGFTVSSSQTTVDTSNLVFPVDGDGNQSSDLPLRIQDNSGKTAYLYGIYLQDEFKPFEPLTINFGGRFDLVNAFVNESQLSPRVNIVYQSTKSTTLHTGYARYFTPPPLELVQSGSIQKFAGTTNASAITQDSPVRSERAHYFDAGIMQQITPAFHVGIDGYYKIAKNQLDEGQFGQALIFSPFNYKKGKIYGAELTANYDQGGFSAYGNVGFSRAMGEKITSGEFQFDPDELAYISKHWVYLDHDQRVTASLGASYAWSGNKVYVDSLFGTGLRKGFANTEKVPDYGTANLGIEHTFQLGNSGDLKVRFDGVNLFDRVYELRDGSGIGVGAPQFGARRGFYGGVSYDF